MSYIDYSWYIKIFISKIFIFHLSFIDYLTWYIKILEAPTTPSCTLIRFELKT